MRARQLSIVGALLLFACGGTAAPTITIGFDSQALVANVTVVRIVFHPGSRSCDAVKASPTARGIKDLVLTLDASQQADGGTAEINELPDQSYTVAAFGLPGTNQDPIASWCETGKTIVVGEQTEINVVLSAI